MWQTRGTYRSSCQPAQCASTNRSVAGFKHQNTHRTSSLLGCNVTLASLNRGCVILTSLLNAFEVLLMIKETVWGTRQKEMQRFSVWTELCNECSGAACHYEDTQEVTTLSWGDKWGDRRQECASDDEVYPGTTTALPVINSRQCLSFFHTDCPNACHDHSLTCVQASQLWFHTAFIYPLCTSLFPVSLHLHSSTPLPPSSEVLLAAVQNFLFNFGDWQPRWCFPFICILCRLLSIPATNGGDSQTVVPELVFSSLGVRAANQRLWWEEKDGFKLHPSQSTGGAHESATSRRFSPSWGSLQIDSDSTPLTSETPTRASPIKSLLWFPLLIINASEFSEAVIGTCLWGFLVHVHICASSIHLILWLQACVCAFL